MHSISFIAADGSTLPAPPLSLGAAAAAALAAASFSTNTSGFLTFTLPVSYPAGANGIHLPSAPIPVAFTCPTAGQNPDGSYFALPDNVNASYLASAARVTGGVPWPGMGDGTGLTPNSYLAVGVLGIGNLTVPVNFSVTSNHPDYSGSLPPTLSNNAPWVSPQWDVVDVTASTQLPDGRWVPLYGNASAAYFNFQVDCGPGMPFAHITCGAGSYGRTVNSSCALPTIAPVCGYWDTDSGTWSNGGCFVVESTPDSITCACAHMTDFGARFSALGSAQAAIFAETLSLGTFDLIFTNRYIFIVVFTLIAGMCVLMCCTEAVDRVAARRFYRSLQGDTELAFLRLVERAKGNAFVLDRFLDDEMGASGGGFSDGNSSSSGGSVGGKGGAGDALTTAQARLAARLSLTHKQRSMREEAGGWIVASRRLPVTEAESAEAGENTATAKKSSSSSSRGRAALSRRSSNSRRGRGPAPLSLKEDAAADTSSEYLGRRADPSLATLADAAQTSLGRAILTRLYVSSLPRPASSASASTAATAATGGQQQPPVPTPARSASENTVGNNTQRSGGGGKRGVLFAESSSGSGSSSRRRGSSASTSATAAESIPPPAPSPPTSTSFGPTKLMAATHSSLSTLNKQLSAGSASGQLKLARSCRRGRYTCARVVSVIDALAGRLISCCVRRILPPGVVPDAYDTETAAGIAAALATEEEQQQQQPRYSSSSAASSSSTLLAPSSPPSSSNLLLSGFFGGGNATPQKQQQQRSSSSQRIFVTPLAQGQTSTSGGGFVPRSAASQLQLRRVETRMSRSARVSARWHRLADGALARAATRAPLAVLTTGDNAHSPPGSPTGGIGSGGGGDTDRSLAVLAHPPSPGTSGTSADMMSVITRQIASARRAQSHLPSTRKLNLSGSAIRPSAASSASPSSPSSPSPSPYFSFSRYGSAAEGTDPDEELGPGSPTSTLNAASLPEADAQRAEAEVVAAALSNASLDPYASALYLSLVRRYDRLRVTPETMGDVLALLPLDAQAELLGTESNFNGGYDNFNLGGDGGGWASMMQRQADALGGLRARLTTASSSSSSSSSSSISIAPVLSLLALNAPTPVELAASTTGGPGGRARLLLVVSDVQREAALIARGAPTPTAAAAVLASVDAAVASGAVGGALAKGHATALKVLTEVRAVGSKLDAVKPGVCGRAWELRGFLLRICCLRLYFNHMWCSPCTRFDPYLSRSSRLCVLFAMVLSDMFITAFWFNFMFGGAVTALGELAFSDMLLVAVLSALVQQPITLGLMTLATLAGEAEFRLRYPFLDAELTRRRQLEEALASVDLATLKRELRRDPLAEMGPPPPGEKKSSIA